MPTLVLPALEAHPALPGHFPGRPIVPGVVLLDLAQCAVEKATGSQMCGIAMAKFISPAGPGDSLWLDYEEAGNGVRFEIRTESRRIASGRFACLETAGNG